MTAVGAVVVNRVRSGSYPNSIYNVIYQRGQFGLFIGFVIHEYIHAVGFIEILHWRCS